MMRPVGAGSGFVCARASRTPARVVQSNLRPVHGEHRVGPPVAAAVGPPARAGVLSLLAAVDGSRFSLDVALLPPTSDLSRRSSSRGARRYWRQGVRRDDADGYMLARTARATSKHSFKVSRVFG